MRARRWRRQRNWWCASRGSTCYCSGQTRLLLYPGSSHGSRVSVSSIMTTCVKVWSIFISEMTQTGLHCQTWVNRWVWRFLFCFLKISFNKRARPRHKFWMIGDECSDVSFVYPIHPSLFYLPVFIPNQESGHGENLQAPSKICICCSTRSFSHFFLLKVHQPVPLSDTAVD